MDPSSEVAQDLSPFLRIYKDGRVERVMGTAVVPPSTDPVTGVQSKDVQISPETGVSARLYLPKIADPPQKLPILVYYHGGAFCIESAASPTYHNYLNGLVAETNVIAVSVDYRRAPEDPLPAAYNDSWTALQWVASGGAGEEWLNRHADLCRLYLAGDSAGANIIHRLAVRAGQDDIGGGVTIRGIVLVHPFFWGEEPIGSESARGKEKAMVDGIWRFVYPATNGCDHPWINPACDSKLSALACERVLICVAGKDVLRDRAWHYRDTLKQSGWKGLVEVMEAEEENHVFHLFNPSSDNANAMLKRLGSFINQDKA